MTKSAQGEYDVKASIAVSDGKRADDGTSMLYTARMCETCNELDKSIELYRRMIRSILDPVALSEAKKLLAVSIAKKTTLHPM